MATTVYERGIGRGENIPLPFTHLRVLSVQFSGFSELLNFAVDPENHTETYSGLSYKPAGTLITLTTIGPFVPFRPPPPSHFFKPTSGLAG